MTSKEEALKLEPKYIATLKDDSTIFGIVEEITQEKQSFPALDPNQPEKYFKNVLMVRFELLKFKNRDKITVPLASVHIKQCDALTKALYAELEDAELS